MTVRAAKTSKSPAAKTVRPVASAPTQRSLTSDAPSMDEPTLHEMLRDPIMQRLMSSDGITRSQLLTLVAAARSRMQADRHYTD